MAMTVGHPLTAADQAAMTALRADLAAHPVAMTRALCDHVIEQRLCARVPATHHTHARAGVRAPAKAYPEWAMTTPSRKELAGSMPKGTIHARGKRINASCVDVSRLRNGQDQVFNGLPL
jgi:hypothetical protein